MGAIERIIAIEVTDDDTSHLSPEQRKTLESVPEYLKPTAIRAFGAGSRSAAIKLFCSSCVGHVRKDVTNCTAKGCALYPYRPWQGGADE